MDAQIVKYLVLGVVAVVTFGVAPIVMALLAHQQKMAALFSKQGLEAAELRARIEMLERRLEAPVVQPQGNRDKVPLKDY